MNCPNCNSGETKVIDSRPEREGHTIRRRRECEECDVRFSTIERVVIGTFVVKKRDGSTEPFDFEKLVESVMKSCGKLPVRREEIREDLRGRVESWASRQEVSTEEIGEAVMEVLRARNEVAFIRYASVYREFADLKEFENQVKSLLRKKK